MHTFRLLLLWLLRILCVIAVSGTVYLVTISSTLLDRHDVKEWLGASGIYKDGVLISALFTQQPTTQAAPTTTVTTSQDIITQDAIKKALVRTFPAPYLKQQFNTVVDTSYDWMEGKRTKFSFLVPIDTKRQTFINELVKEVEPTVAALPPCAPFSQALCRPTTMTVPDFTRQLVTDSLASSDFLQTPITQTSFSSATSSSELSMLSELPMLRQVVSLLLWILPVLFVVTLVGALLLAEAPNRFALCTKLSRTVFSSMALAVILSGALIIVQKVYGLPIEAAMPNVGALAPFVAGFTTALLLSFAWTLLYVALIPLLISLIGWISFSQLKKHRNPQAMPVTNDLPPSPHAPVTTLSSSQPAPLQPSPSAPTSPDNQPPINRL